MKPIQIWSFYDAPKRLRKLSTHGGDEDWLALIPKSTFAKYGLPHWMDGGSEFGVCDTSCHPLQNGDVVAIGAHA